jgi:hypothetical protein
MGKREKCCPTQVQGWAFKMKGIPSISSCIGIQKMKVKGNIKLSLCLIRHHNMKMYVEVEVHVNV